MSNNNATNGNLNDGLTLKQTVGRACKKIQIGAAVMYQPLIKADIEDYNGSEELQDAAQTLQSTHYARVLQQEFNAIVVEHHMKWSPLCISEPGPLPNSVVSDRLGRYDFHYSDTIVDWALKNDLFVKGHVLVWSVTSPTALLQNLTSEQVAEELKRHIFTVMGHYRGRITCWDVVNEPLAPDGSLANNVFLQKLGPSYIEQSFLWAHEADPTATLILNENKVESPESLKGQRFYELMADLKQRKIPVHGVGLQMHLNAAGIGRQRPPTPRMLKEQIRQLGDLGLSVNLSEMDVRVSQLPPEIRNVAHRQIYHDLSVAALSEPACDGIYLWGFTDRHTWVTHFYYDDEPLIFDEDYRRKEAYYALRDALANFSNNTTTTRTVVLDYDLEEDGQPWGHLWMQPEPESDGIMKPESDGIMKPASVASRSASMVAGDARPDWEVEKDQRSRRQRESEKEMDSGEEGMHDSGYEASGDELRRIRSREEDTDDEEDHDGIHQRRSLADSDDEGMTTDEDVFRDGRVNDDDDDDDDDDDESHDETLRSNPSVPLPPLS